MVLGVSPTNTTPGLPDSDQCRAGSLVGTADARAAMAYRTGAFLLEKQFLTGLPSPRPDHLIIRSGAGGS
jgi:hypothetical protein